MLHDLRSQIRYEYFCYWAKVRYYSRWNSIPFKGKGGRSSNAKAINIGNENKWSPIRSAIIQVIKKIGRPLSYQSRDLSVTNIIIDRIGHHKVLLPMNHNHYNFGKKPNTSRTNISAREDVLRKKNSSIWEIPQFFFLFFSGWVVVAIVIVINYVIGGFSWVDLV